MLITSEIKDRLEEDWIMKRMLICMLALTLTVCLSGVALADGLNMKLASGVMPDYVTNQALLFFADRVAELSEGRMTVEVCDVTSEYNDEAAYLAQMQSGELAMARISLNTVKNIYADMQVFSLPFMFKDSDELWAVLNSDVGVQMMNGLNASNLQGIGFTDAGSRSFYTVEPIASIEDFAGRKIRVQQIEPMTSMIECLGAEPANVAAFDLYDALKKKTCDGGENTLVSIMGMGYHDVAKYITLDNHTISVDTICMNLDLWNSLSEADQAVIRQAMDEAMAYDREIWDASAAEAEQALVDAGAVVTRPDDAVLNSFREAMAPLYAQYEDTLGAWIDAIDAVLGR